MTDLRRLPADERFKEALRFLGARVQVDRFAPGTGNRSTFTGHVTSVPNLLLGNSDALLVLRTDQTRIDKDLGFSLAQVAITRLDFDGRPIEET